MGYDHSLSFEATCLPEVTKDQVLEALSGVATYMYWKREDLERGGQLSGEDEVLFLEEDGRMVFSMSTSGDVGYSYPDLIRQFCQQMSPLVEPAMLELRDHDTGDLEESIERIWVGTGQALVDAQREHALHVALKTLSDGGFSEQELNEVRHALGFQPAATTRDRPKK